MHTRYVQFVFRWIDELVDGLGASLASASEQTVRTYTYVRIVDI